MLLINVVCLRISFIRAYFFYVIIVGDTPVFTLLFNSIALLFARDEFFSCCGFLIFLRSVCVEKLVGLFFLCITPLLLFVVYRSNPEEYLLGLNIPVALQYLRSLAIVTS